MIEPTWESDCGTVKLWLGDCLEVLPSWGDGAVDCVVTDPPYGIGGKWNSQQTGKRGSSRLWDGTQSWDFKTEPERVMAAVSVSGQSIIWGGNYYNLPPSRGYLIWDKVQRFSNADSELVEMVDALIRIFDYAGAFGLDLEGAYREKMEFNRNREDHKHETRKAEGGKKF